MKRISFRHITLLLAVLAAGVAVAAGVAQATFSTKSHDFGYIKEAKGPVSCTFEFTNAAHRDRVHSIVRLHPSRIPHQAHQAGQKGQDKGHLQPYRAAWRVPQNHQGED